MRALDAQVIGSTLVPEAPLCREVCIKYASIGIIARYATGMDQDVTDEDLLRISAQKLWDSEKHAFAFRNSRAKLMVGASSEDIRLKKNVKL